MRKDFNQIKMVRNILKTMIFRNHKNYDFLQCNSSSKLINESDCSILFDYWNGEGFQTQGVENDWIDIHITTFEIIPNSYKIFSFGTSANLSHMKTWNLSASNNGEEWDIIDKQENVTELNNPNAVKVFPLHYISRSYSYFRITLIESWDGTTTEVSRRLSIKHIDFNGETSPAITNPFDHQKLIQLNRKVFLMVFCIVLTNSK